MFTVNQGQPTTTTSETDNGTKTNNGTKTDKEDN